MQLYRFRKIRLKCKCLLPIRDFSLFCRLVYELIAQKEGTCIFYTFYT